MKKEIIVGIIVGLIIGLVIGVFIANSFQKQLIYHNFSIHNLDKIKGSDFEKIEYTSQDCYKYFIEERIKYIENPYNKNEWACLIDSFSIYSLRHPNTNELNLFWYNPTCKCWKK